MAEQNRRKKVRQLSHGRKGHVPKKQQTAPARATDEEAKQPIRAKQNKPQHTLKGSERRKNVKGVYRVIDKTAIKDKRILLIDDIITTGNTLGECASVLKHHGCRSVSCVVLCTTLV
jgi:predicted amidophosphoribosyltransferase